MLILSSCNTEKRIQKRCEKHAEKARSLGCLTNDTTDHTLTITGFIHDTLYKSKIRTEIKSDTVIRLTPSGVVKYITRSEIRGKDTFQMTKDGIQQTIFVDWDNKTANVNISKKDTVIKYQTVNQVITKVQKEKVNIWRIIVLTAGIVSAIFLGIIYLLKRKK